MSTLRAAVMIETEAANLPADIRVGMLRAAELLRAQAGGEL
jgi:hypothetical protein